MRTFPVDDVTLAMLESACQISPGEEQTHLHDFLRFGEVIVSERDDGEMLGLPVKVVEHLPGTEPFSEHQVILALIAEIRRLRNS